MAGYPPYNTYLPPPAYYSPAIPPQVTPSYPAYSSTIDPKYSRTGGPQTEPNYNVSTGSKPREPKRITRTGMKLNQDPPIPVQANPYVPVVPGTNPNLYFPRQGPQNADYDETYISTNKAFRHSARHGPPNPDDEAYQSPNPPNGYSAGEGRPNPGYGTYPPPNPPNGHSTREGRPNPDYADYLSTSPPDVIPTTGFNPLYSAQQHPQFHCRPLPSARHPSAPALPSARHPSAPALPSARHPSASEPKVHSRPVASSRHSSALEPALNMAATERRSGRRRATFPVSESSESETSGEDEQYEQLKVLKYPPVKPENAAAKPKRESRSHRPRRKKGSRKDKVAEEVPEPSWFSKEGFRRALDDGGEEDEDRKESDVEDDEVVYPGLQERTEKADRSGRDGEKRRLRERRTRRR